MPESLALGDDPFDQNALQRAAGFEHLTRLLGCGFGDCCTLVGHDLHQLFKRQPLQNLADDGSAHAESRGE